MICKKCGHELKENEVTCSFCGTAVSESDKIQVTYTNNGTEVVDAPVITEAHTFIDEESFAKKVNTIDQKNPISKDNLDDMWKDSSKKGPFVWVFVIGIVLIIGLVGYFVIFPNIKVDSKKRVQEVEDFTTKQWQSGEFKIEGDFYQLNKPFLSFDENNWKFVDEEILELSLDPKEETLEYAITNDSKQGRIKIRIKNINDTETVVKDSMVWSIKIDTREEDNNLTFELPGKIKNNSTADEITEAYGKLTANNIKREVNNHFATYYYIENDITLELVVDDNEGLIAFQYYNI